jgi:hypothetical protein
MSLLQRCLMLAMSVALAGCVPWPHHRLTAPAIDGTVLHAGRPAAGVRVQLADLMTESGDMAADARHREAVTDGEGRFSFKPIKRFSWHASVPLVSVSQHTAPWGLRLGTGADAWKAGWLSDPTLIGDIPHAPLIATCNVDAASKSSVIKGRIALVGNGSCDLSVSESK